MASKILFDCPIRLFVILAYDIIYFNTIVSFFFCKNQSVKKSFSKSNWEGSSRQIRGTEVGLFLWTCNFYPSSTLCSFLCFRRDLSIASAAMSLSSPSLGQIILLNLYSFPVLLSILNYIFTCDYLYYPSFIYLSSFIYYPRRPYSELNEE